MEILRLHVNGDWDISSNIGHYKLNKKLNIKELAEIYDGASNTIDVHVDVNISSKTEWLNKTVRLQYADIECYTDASVDRRNNRTGIGIICTGLLNFTLSEQYPIVTSSYIAEARAFDVASTEIVKSKPKNQTIDFRIDNLNVIKSVANSCIQSKTFNKIRVKIMKLQRDGNTVSLTWVPAHLDRDYLIHYRALRFNSIADRLAANANANFSDWKPFLLKSDIKKKLTIDAFKSMSREWENSKIIAKNFKFNQLTANMIESLESNSKKMTNLLHLNREEFFLVISFYSGTGYNRAYMTKCIADQIGRRKFHCRGCNKKDETTTHLLTECPKYNATRLLLYDSISIDLDEIDFDPSKLLRFLKKTKLNKILTNWDPLLPVSEPSRSRR